MNEIRLQAPRTRRFSARKAALASTLAGAVALSSLVFSSAALGDEASDVFALKNRFEHTLTEVPASDREDTLGNLADDATTLAEAHPDNADALIWQGIVLASYARERGGLGALGDAKIARKALERAIKIDPQGNGGSAYVTLGALYDRVPGGLISFGDSDTAERMFQRALDIRPDGIDVNYYYATFLAEEGKTQAAREHAQRAMSGTARQTRKASDEALRRQAKALFDTL